MPLLNYLYIFLAAIAAGLINALAGGGTLLTFPVLLAVGLPSVAANVTNSIALVPGFFGATLAQIQDLKDQKKLLWMMLPVSALGGLLGSILLIKTGEQTFRSLVPYLIIGAALLLAVQDKIRAWLMHRSATGRIQLTPAWIILPVGLATIYGGYFGAGASVIILAVIGLVLDDTLTRLNALKQIIGFTAGSSAAIFFIFSGYINWPLALVMMAGSLLGGALGGRFADMVKPVVLRWVVVTIGIIVGIIYLFR